MKLLPVKWNHYEHGDPDGKPIVFLHGFMGSGRVWQPIVEELPSDMYTIALDLPGHGLTWADLEYLDFNTLSKALIEFVNEHLDREPVLMGYSLGGRIALYTALKYPDNFRALVIESASPGIESDKDRALRLDQDRKMASRLRISDMRSFLIDWYRQPVFESLNPDLKERIINKKTGNNPEQLASVYVRLSQGIQPPLWLNLPAWDKPILIVAGEKDRKYVDIASRMAALMVSAEVKIISGAGHIVHLENHKDFTTALNLFLRSIIL